jgi:predicted dehydrogenase
MSQIRVGIVGAGMIAHRYAGVLARFEDVEVRALADPVPERAEELAAAYVSAAAYRSHLDMLDAETLTPCTAGGRAPAELSEEQHPSSGGRTVGCVH